MQINDKWKIEADTNNIILLEAHTITGEGRGRTTTKKIGEVYWTPAGYYGTVKSALEGLIRREIKGSGLKDLETVVKKIDELYALLNNIKLPSDLPE